MQKNVLTIAVMFGMVFMVGFVTMFTGSIGTVVKSQFGASNAMAQLGTAVTFMSYFFMGIPAGVILKRRGYRFTSLLAVTIGFAGVAIQLGAGWLESFPIYILGAFVAGLSMCILNVTANPMMNTLGGGGNGGNRLVQFGCSVNSIGGMSAPLLLGFLFGNDMSKARVLDAAPAQLIALGVFALGFFVIFRAQIPEPHLESSEGTGGSDGTGGMWRDILKVFRFRHFALGALALFFFDPVEAGIPNMANLYLTAEGTPAYTGAAIAGTLVAGYCGCMMLGRFVAGLIGEKVSARIMIVTGALVCISLLITIVSMPLSWAAVPFAGRVPVSMVLMMLCGACTSVMFGGIFNLATEGLGRYVPVASGVIMSMVLGGSLLSVQGAIADHVGILNSYWMSIGLLMYIAWYAVFGSRVVRRADEGEVKA